MKSKRRAIDEYIFNILKFKNNIRIVAIMPCFPVVLAVYFLYRCRIRMGIKYPGWYAMVRLRLFKKGIFGGWYCFC